MDLGGALRGITVLDLSRMLPGAVLARQLLDLGAELIKVEDPAMGDPLRHAPPLAGGVGLGFAVFYRGARSLGLDLREPEDAAKLRKLSKSADVVVESFRPGTLEGWGLGYPRLRALNPALIFCSLSAFGQSGPWAQRVGHDLNLMAMSGLLPRLGCRGVPGIQLADVTSGLLACSAVLAALVQRGRTGAGRLIDQPLAVGPLPFLAWAWANATAGGGGIVHELLAGRAPCYQLYVCGDGKEMALGALEPKFWTGFVQALGLPDLAGAGFATGPEGERAMEAVTKALSASPRQKWLELLWQKGLPVSPVNDLDQARSHPYFAQGGLLEDLPLPDGKTLAAPGPFLPSLGRTPASPAPAQGADTEELLRSQGLV